MKRKCLIATVLISLFLLPALSLAANSVDIKIKAEKLTTVIKDGKKVTKAIPYKKFQPGDTILYTITYTNNTNEAVSNAVIDDPIPAGTAYIPESATGEGTEITYSIDKGKTFNKPTLLVYQVETRGKKEQRVATPDQYTNIRWTIPNLKIKGSGKVSFKVSVK